MSEAITLQSLADDAALLSIEHQLHLHQVLGEHRWDVDLAQPRLVFTGERTITCTSFHLLGSAAPGPGSWLWGWANPSPGFAEEITALSAAVRDFAQQHGIGELASAEVPFDALPGSPADATEACVPLTDAVKSLTGRWTSYGGDAGGGTRVVFLVEHSAFQLPEPTAFSVGSVLQMLAELQVTDPQHAVQRYAQQRGLQATLTPDRTKLTILGPGFEMAVAFDQHHRVASIESTLHAARGGNDPAHLR